MPPLCPTLQQFLEAMVEAFDQQALVRLARFRLGVRLDVIIDPVGSTPQLIDRLIRFVEGGGWTEELIRGAHEENPAAPCCSPFARRTRLTSSHPGRRRATSRGRFGRTWAR